MKPLIGISPLFDPDTNAYSFRSTYPRAIEAAGGIPLILPVTDDFELLNSLLDQLDGLLFSGGHDIEPARYAQRDHNPSQKYCPIRDRMEIHLFKQAAAADLPVLGICRGLQLINVASGGDLYQDIESEVDHSLHHFVLPKGGQGLFCDEENNHQTRILPGTPLFDLFKEEYIEINSYHHQSLRNIPANMEIMACSEDGIVEAARLTDKTWIWGVQWHPEILAQNDPSQLALFKSLVSQAQNYQSRKHSAR